MTELTHKSERKECERELVNMPGKWRVARKNDRYEFRLSIKPGVHYFVIQYRSLKPAGWVVFEAKALELSARQGATRTKAWAERKKIDPLSYPSPGAAAVALVVANRIPVG